MAEINISYTFDLNEDAEDIKTIMGARDCRCLIYEIDCLIRYKLKHGEDDWLETEAHEFLEGIRTKIWSSGILNDT